MRQPTVVLVSVLALAPLVILAALYFVLLPDPDAAWGPWPAVVGVLGVAGVVLAELVGYRTTPIPAQTPREAADTQARQQWQASMILRFVVSEAPFILTVSLAFVVLTPEPVLLVALSALITSAGIVFHCWPWSRPVGKVAEGLERDGARTGLREDLGVLTAR